MTKIFRAAISAALALGLCGGRLASADDAPPPTTPTDPNAPPDKPHTDEKAGKDEGLDKGAGDERPWAKGVAVNEQNTALALFRDGNTFLNQGLFLKASEKYKEALTHWDHPGINYNLALALLNLDQPIEVYNALQKSIKYGPAPLEADKFEHAKEYLILIQKQIAEIEVSCDKPGADVSVDGKHVFFAPGKFSDKVKIGKHTFVCQKPGSITRIKAPYIGPNEHFRIELKLYTAEDLTRYHRKWQATWFPYVVIGGGALIAGAGGLLELSARSSFSDFDKQVATCNMASNNGGCATSMKAIADLRSSGNSKQSLAYVGYGVGGGIAVIGGLLAYANRRQSYQIRAEDLQGEKDDQPAGVSFAPLVTPSMAGAVVQGHF